LRRRAQSCLEDVCEQDIALLADQKEGVSSYLAVVAVGPLEDGGLETHEIYRHIC